MTHRRVLSLSSRKRNSNKNEQEEDEDVVDPVTSSSFVSATTKTSTTTATVVTPSPQKKKKAKTITTTDAKVVGTKPRKIALTSTTVNKKKKSIVRAVETRSPPDDFASLYSLVTELRQDRTAPCDSMGAEALALAYHNNNNNTTTTAAATTTTTTTTTTTKEEEQDKLYRLIVLISLLLSSQTKDAVVASAMQQLHQQNFLSLDKLSDPQYKDEIHHCIRSVGFHNNKIKYLQQTASILQTQFHSDIPLTADEMIQHLPGVGPKMAYLCEALAWPHQEPSGIGVDTHMHRLFQQIQWTTTSKAKTPEHTRLELQSWLPREYWREINVLWVGFGQEVQQQAPKVLYKAVYECSRPKEALQLLQRCGMNVKQVALQQQQKQQPDENGTHTNDLLKRVEELLSRAK